MEVGEGVALRPSRRHFRKVPKQPKYTLHREPGDGAFGNLGIYSRCRNITGG
jgi:hypothetical protein